MSEENIEVLRKAYSDFNGGNVEAVLGTMHPEIEWTEPGGGNSASGTFKGPESVGKDVFALIPENFDEFSVNAEDFKDDGDTVVVTGRFKAKAKSGAELDNTPFTHTWEFRDGKPAKFNNEVDADAWTAAWS